MKKSIVTMLIVTLLCALCAGGSAEIGADSFAESSLLQFRGDAWALIGNFFHQEKSGYDTLDASIYLKSPSTSTKTLTDTDTPYIMLYLGTTRVTSSADLRWDTIRAFRVTVDGVCYAFDLVRMNDSGEYGLIRCGETARSLLSALAGSNQAEFEIDYTQYDSNQDGTFSAILSASDYAEWIEFGQLLENAGYWDTLSTLTLYGCDISTSITQK
ncbi:MAG: hypothetical protein IJ234_06780 [Clostridia bacterium]|nr:hypothetical protein [Clostridia bacterium]